MSDKAVKIVNLLPGPRNIDEAKKLMESAVRSAQGAISAHNTRRTEFEKIYLASATPQLPDLMDLLRKAQLDLTTLTSAANNHRIADEALTEMASAQVKEAWIQRNALFRYETSINVIRREAPTIAQLIGEIEKMIDHRKRELESEIHIHNSIGGTPEQAVIAASNRFEHLVIELNHHSSTLSDRLETIEERLTTLEKSQEDRGAGISLLVEGLLEQISRHDQSNKVLRDSVMDAIKNVTTDITRRMDRRIGQTEDGIDSRFKDLRSFTENRTSHLEKTVAMRFTNWESRLNQVLDEKEETIIGQLAEHQKTIIEALSRTQIESDEEQRERQPAFDQERVPAQQPEQGAPEEQAARKTHQNYGNLPTELLQLLEEPELALIEQSANFQPVDILQMVKHHYQDLAQKLGEIGAQRAWVSGHLKCSFCSVSAAHRSQECDIVRQQKEREAIRLEKEQCRRCLNTHPGRCTATLKECINCVQAREAGFDELHREKHHHPALCRWVEEGDRIRRVATLAAEELRRLQELRH